jgi:Chitobiase/beta-hexosaminidase C-terminal domain/Pectate lyase superfamily protein
MVPKWTRLAAVLLLGGGAFAAISYGIASRNNPLHAAFSHRPGGENVSAAHTLLLTARLLDTIEDTSTSAQDDLAAGPSVGPGSPLTGCGGPTIDLNPAMSQGTLTSKISHAPGCALIAFAAGTYNITAPIHIPCGVTVTGPTATPATAILAAAYTGKVIFDVKRCSTPVTIGYLHFENTGAIYVTAPMLGITITHSQFTNLPATRQQWSNMGIYFDGNNGEMISNAKITNNTFGDPSSCAAVMSIDHDEGGLCNGIFFQGNLDGIVIENNTFTHLEEGFHVICFAGDKCTGSGAPTWNHFIVRWNDFNNIHRIAAEMQPQPATDVVIAYNSYEDPFAPSTFSMGFSLACCAGVSGATVPFVNHNVLLANVPPAGKYIAYAIEWWGNGAQANNNLIQGYWANGIVWGLGGGPWEVRNSVIQGPYMAGPYGCYVCDEKEGATTTPTRSGNLTSTTITPIISIPPTISPAGGAISNPATVTLADRGNNHSIYYTTDGSTPSTSSTLYTAPFQVSPGTTVKAIGMWGRGANPKSYPRGYGYLPSEVVSASYSAAH